MIARAISRLMDYWRLRTVLLWIAGTRYVIWERGGGHDQYKVTIEAMYLGTVLRTSPSAVKLYGIVSFIDFVISQAIAGSVRATCYAVYVCVVAVLNL